MRSSTRSESKVLRTDQSMPPPINAATSLGLRTTESGPILRFNAVTFRFPAATADGVGAPTAVSVTGGNAVRRGPSHRAAPWRIGSRYHHATAPMSSSIMRPTMRSSHLSKRFTPSHLIHRPTALERALHEVQRRDQRRLPDGDRRERLGQTAEIA